MMLTEENHYGPLSLEVFQQLPCFSWSIWWGGGSRTRPLPAQCIGCVASVGCDSV